MAHNEGIHPYTHHKQAHWSTPEGDVLRWVLTEPQLRAFKDYEVIAAQGGFGAPRTGLKRVKDLFVVSASQASDSATSKLLWRLSIAIQITVRSPS